ncbi:MAG: WbqC family protein [Zetaproteobacteria bacterium]|nr:WbqC family protein [Zetaproteobacteria bacterium]
MTQAARSLVVMQPTFLPWAGYFNLMAQADVFVFLDDVQLEKQSWQTRNRLLSNGNVQWVSATIRHVQLSQTIAETQTLIDVRWSKKLMRGFSQNYSKHPYYDAALEIMNSLADHANGTLAGLNEAVIRHVAMRLGISTPMYRASDLNIAGVRSNRLIAFCEHFEANEYISPVGSADYLDEDGFSEKASAKLRFQDYTPLPYFQKGTKEFISHLSIVDVVANLGWDATYKYVIGNTD